MAVRRLLVPSLLRENTVPSPRARLGGKATKRSHFGSRLADQRESTLIASMVCEKANLRYHVLDSEGTEHCLQPGEIAQLASRTSRLQTVLTISSRHSHSNHYLMQIAPLLEKNPHISLNLVTGNPSYLNLEEAKSVPRDTLADLVMLARKLLPEKEIFIGTEGLLDASLALAEKHDLNPFFLLDRSLEHDILKARRKLPMARITVYVPYFVSGQGENPAYEILTSLGPYIVRRRWVRMRMAENGYEPSVESVKRLIEHSEKAGEALGEQNPGRLLMGCASKLAIYGSTLEVVEGFRLLFEKGVDVIIGSPVRDCEEQVIALGQCLSLASSY